MGNILRCFKGDDDADGDHYPYYTPASRPHYQPQGHVARRIQLLGAGSPHWLPLDPHDVVLVQQAGHVDPWIELPPGAHGVTRADAGAAALARDLRNFEATSMVPEGLGEHVRSSKKAQVKWYRKILEAYKDAESLPETPIQAARLVATALSRIQRDNLEGILEFYGFSVPTLPAESSSSGLHHPSSLPDGVQFVLNTRPVDAKCVGDGDGFTAYVDTADPRESARVPLEVHEAVIARAQARSTRNYQRAVALQRSIRKAGYGIVVGADDEEILARTYKIRMRGIDAPELKMPYGAESKNALVELIAGKCVTIHVYGQDKYKRYVGDVYCDGVFIQEQMLKRGFAWHYKTCDKRPEFAQWERQAKAARRGLWASENPEKPWKWRTKQRNAGIRVH